MYAISPWVFDTVAKITFVDLSEILEKHIFVGIVDLPRSLSLVQYSTKLYLVNHGSLAYVSNQQGVHRRSCIAYQGRTILSIGPTPIR